MRLKINNVLEVLEIDGRESHGIEKTVIHVSSHWNYNDRVVLEIEGKTVTILARDLKRAIDNATNHGI